MTKGGTKIYTNEQFTEMDEHSMLFQDACMQYELEDRQNNLNYQPNLMEEDVPKQSMWAFQNH